MLWSSGEYGKRHIQHRLFNFNKISGIPRCFGGKQLEFEANPSFKIEIVIKRVVLVVWGTCRIVQYIV